METRSISTCSREDDDLEEYRRTETEAMHPTIRAATPIPVSIFLFGLRVGPSTRCACLGLPYSIHVRDR
jgi:hypothetical protein